MIEPLTGAHVIIIALGMLVMVYLWYGCRTGNW